MEFKRPRFYCIINYHKNYFLLGHRSSTGAHLHLGRTGSKNPMNVNVCYDRYGKKSSIETGTTNKNIRTNPTTTKNSDRNHEKEAISHALRSSPIKYNSVRAKSDLSSSTLKHFNRGASNNHMAVNRSRSSSGTKTLSRSSTSNSLLPCKPKPNVRSKSDLWGVKKSSKPNMATVVESVVSNGTNSQINVIPPSNSSTNNNTNVDSKISENPKLLNIDSKPSKIPVSKIPVSPSFQRKLRSTRSNDPTGNNSNHIREPNRKLQLTSPSNKACEKPITPTQTSYMFPRQSDQKQASYSQNKERS